MKAVQIHAYGEPEVVTSEKASRPEPKPNEVLVQTHVAAINPLAWKTREGFLQERYSGQNRLTDYESEMGCQNEF